jgi:tetratricopeptide (TPR) repeat protein
MSESRAERQSYCMGASKSHTRHIPPRLSAGVLWGSLGLLLLSLLWGQSTLRWNLALLQLSQAAADQDASALANAQQAMQDSGTLSPLRAAAWAYHQGRAYEILQESAAAQHAYDAALGTTALSPSWEADTRLRNALLLRDDNPIQAIAELETLVAMSLTTLDAYTAGRAHAFLGELIFEQTGDLECYRDHAQQALDLLQDNVTMGRYIRVIYRYLAAGGAENVAQALAMAEIATARQPRNTWTALARCRSLLRMDDLGEATQWCLRSRDLARTNDHAYYWLGVAYTRQAMWDEALAAYEAAAQYDPNNKAYQDAFRRTLTKRNAQSTP